MNNNVASRLDLNDNDVETAQRELEASTASLPADPMQVFAAALAEWERWETERVAQMVAYEHVRELIGQDRNALVRQYATAKHNLAVWERAAIDAFRSLSTSQQEAVLKEGTQVVVERPGILRGYMLNPYLRRRLRGGAVDGANEEVKRG